MAKRKPTATQRLRKLVQQQVRRMENRGYRIDTELKEKIKTGKYQTLQSIRKNKYAKLYEGSSAEIDTNIVSGRRYRQYERKASAEKAVRTRQRKERDRRLYDEAYKRTTQDSYDEENYEDVEWTDADERSYQKWKERRSQDYYDDEEYESDWEEQHDWEETRAKEDEAATSIAQDINQGEIMYRNVVDLIEKFPRAGSDILQKALSAEINKYGLDLVMAGMAQAPVDVIGEAQNIVHYAGTRENIHRSITNLFDAITGTIRSLQESMAIGTVMDAMTDMSEP